VDRGLARAPRNPELLAIRGRIALQQDDLPAARTALEKAVAADPRDADAHLDLASVYRGAGELDRARAEAETALKLAPRSAAAHVGYGLVLGALGREEEAAEAFRTALRAQTDHPDALFYLASVELRAGHAPRAAQLFQRLLARAPGYPGAAQALAAAEAQSAVQEAPTASPVPGGSPAVAVRTVHLRLIRTANASQAEDAARRATGGEDFALLARQISSDASAARGGDLGGVTPQDLAEPLRSAALGLAPGQVSAVITLPDGYAILKRER